MNLIIRSILIISAVCWPLPADAEATGPAIPVPAAQAGAAPKSDGVCITPAKDGDYAIGVDDILTIDVLQPEKIESNVTVSPDGNISFPYIGSIPVKGRSLSEVEQDIQTRLASGYLKYPLVVVYLKQSRSRRFFVYGEVNHPGPYQLEDNTTVLRAISMAGGFTRFGSASSVKVLRPKKGAAGYETIQINIRAVMHGNSEEDVILKPGDMVVVSEGVF
ncbi:MAG: polysaccharide export protein [Candidatus Omnitrophica bacterium]|nr:polysaccharide export protein [Candidatus Omnitrophota bacterium]